jgi:hypothetical protein
MTSTVSLNSNASASPINVVKALEAEYIDIPGNDGESPPIELTKINADLCPFDASLDVSYFAINFGRYEVCIMLQVKMFDTLTSSNLSKGPDPAIPALRINIETSMFLNFDSIVFR